MLWQGGQEDTEVIGQTKLESGNKTAKCIPGELRKRENEVESNWLEIQDRVITGEYPPEIRWLHK